MNIGPFINWFFDSLRTGITITFTHSDFNDCYINKQNYKNKQFQKVSDNYLNSWKWFKVGQQSGLSAANVSLNRYLHKKWFTSFKDKITHLSRTLHYKYSCRINCILRKIICAYIKYSYCKFFVSLRNQILQGIQAIYNKEYLFYTCFYNKSTLEFYVFNSTAH